MCLLHNSLELEPEVNVLQLSRSLSAQVHCQLVVHRKCSAVPSVTTENASLTEAPLTRRRVAVATCSSMFGCTSKSSRAVHTLALLLQTCGRTVQIAPLQQIMCKLQSIGPTLLTAVSALSR